MFGIKKHSWNENRMMIFVVMQLSINSCLENTNVAVNEYFYCKIYNQVYDSYKSRDPQLDQVDIHISL